MNAYSFGRRELASLATVALLAPALRLFPSTGAELAGRGGWLSALLAALPVLAYLWFVSLLMGARQDGENLQELTLRLLGPAAGRAALILTALWLLLYGGFILRAGADRLIVTIYPNADPGGFSIVMGLLALISALGSARSLIRVARMTQPVVLGSLAIILFFSFFSVKRENLLPLTAADALPVLEGSLGAVNIMSLGVYAVCFLEGGTPKTPGRFRAFALWAVSFSLLLCLIIGAIIGGYSAELTAELTRPFGVLVRNLVFFRTIERVEALVVMLWIFPDFLLSSLLLCAAQRSLRLALGKPADYGGQGPMDFSHGRWLIWLCATAMILCALFIAPDSQSLSLWSLELIPTLNMLYAFAVLPLIYIVGKLRKTL